jgi:hypothetical protein
VDLALRSFAILRTGLAELSNAVARHRRPSKSYFYLLGKKYHSTICMLLAVATAWVIFSLGKNCLFFSSFVH